LREINVSPESLIINLNPGTFSGLNPGTTINAKSSFSFP
jgi:hypothetical protein